MKSRIEEVRRILPPPTSPRNTDGDWSVVESSLGTSLPADYKEFTRLYGSVKICDYLVIHTAFPWNEESREFLLSLNQEYDEVTNGRHGISFPDCPVRRAGSAASRPGLTFAFT